jgi:membrane-bound metal-dependent hydrolase YbcI (DUF457 family)
VTTSSHLAGSALIYLLAGALAESPPSVAGLAASALGSLLPDIDAPTSSIGRPFFPLASWLNRRVGHRTVTHSLLGMAGFALVLAGLGYLAELAGLGEGLSAYVWPLVVGYGSHLLVDTLNKTGVELFWPSGLRCVFFFNEGWRIASAGRGDYWFMVLCLMGSLGAYPLARDGFTLSVHRAFGDIYSVSMDFKEHGERRRAWLDLEGVEGLTNRRVSGRFELLAALDSGSVLIEREGVKQIVSRTAPLQIYPTRTAIVLGEPQEISVVRVDMAGKTLGEIPRFPEARRVLIHGFVTPVRLPRVSVREDRLDTVSIRFDKVKLGYAEYGDLRGMESLLVREGVITLAVYRSAGSPAGTEDGDFGKPGERVEHVSLRFSPADEVYLKEGERVEFGQVIGRRDTRLALIKLEQDCRRDLESLRQKVEENGLRLGEAREALFAAEAEVQELKRDLLTMSGEPLLERERLAGDRALSGGRRRLAELARRVRTLEREREYLDLQGDARRARLGQDRELALAQAEIRSSFSGRVVQARREVDGGSVVYSVFYRAAGE